MKIDDIEPILECGKGLYYFEEYSDFIEENNLSQLDIVKILFHDYTTNTDTECFYRIDEFGYNVINNRLKIFISNDVGKHCLYITEFAAILDNSIYNLYCQKVELYHPTKLGKYYIKYSFNKDIIQHYL